MGSLLRARCCFRCSAHVFALCGAVHVDVSQIARESGEENV